MGWRDAIIWFGQLDGAHRVALDQQVEDLDARFEGKLVRHAP